jgi:alkanesulfonate monooxygenase SsuD/methylene tetrahydromethanopterin reductase-like flavin-dependent oxidoreductase (luciferase family)
VDVNAPLAPGSISLRLYPHDELPADRIVGEMRAQAELAEASGFDGLMTSEHHGGFAGYMPNPLQAASWLLESTSRSWAAACPLLLTLRPAALVAEEVAWLAACFPGRVGLGVAAGSLPVDFEIMGLTQDHLTGRFAAALTTVAGMLSGSDPGPLASDPALARCVGHPVPVVSAAMSHTAVRRAARLGVGIVADSLSTPGRVRALTDSYRDEGGGGACVLIRRAWVGEPPARQVEEQMARYRGYADPGAQAHWQGQQLLASPDPVAVADELAAVATSAGADALNLRVHAPGVAPGAVRDQIAALADVVTRLRRVWGTAIGDDVRP